jgi:ribose 1,5-bisphosphokinase PhnN
MISTTVAKGYVSNALLKCMKISPTGIEKLTSRLQTGSTNQESINVRLSRQFLAVLLAHTAAVDNSGLRSSLIINLLR